MGREPRAASRLEWIFIWVALGGLTFLVVAWHLSVLGQSGEMQFQSNSLFDKNLPPPQRHDFKAPADPREQSIDGLKAAALEQIKAAQLIGRDEEVSVWSTSSCRTWEVLPMTMIVAQAERPPSIYDMVVTDVEVYDFEGDTARVRVIFRHATDRKLRVANEVGGTERWDYVPGGWVNRTCEYSEGPSLKQMFREGTIRLAD